MRDSKECRRFFFTDSTAGVVELAKNNSNSMQSPCVVMESDVEGGGPIERPVMNYPVYFFVMAKKMSDGDAAAIAKNEAKMHARRFLAWLKSNHDREIDENKLDGDFARIDLDGYVSYQTIGPLQNGWYAVLVQMEREEPLNLCVDDDLYIDTCDDTESDIDS